MEVDFGAGPRRVPRSVVALNLTAGGLVPAEGRVDWSQLSALPALRTMTWSGPDRGLVAALTIHDIRFLEWHDAIGRLDLSSTRLDTVRLSGTGLDSVRLSGLTRTLLVRRPPAALRVEAPEQGERLDLRWFCYDGALSIPDGLARVPTLWLWAGAGVSMRALSSLTNLRDLRLTLDAAPGVVSDLDELGRHERLRRLQLGDAYGLDPATLPDLPALRELELHGTRDTIVRALQARFASGGGPVELSVTGAKSQEWLARFLHNPLQDWVDESEPFARAACEAYEELVRVAESVAPDAPDRMASLECALRGFVARLNALDEEYELIDTILREHAWVVYAALAERLQVPAELAEEWFDDTRDW
ncbi:hypothetical protein SAMN05421812_117166 [Asanoa hainanensis]|uniref:Leucine Rich repeat-containing protein n=1 Tax=Asanoa hainanensis TaxID=560556 RepID=A0A239PCF0_9ACTN|nr:hypothetical protein [Asanoa hainanensis]SNT64653.1 hypothetical protein SAMN05421812_117166 [Asanoa hainanensis]